MSRNPAYKLIRSAVCAAAISAVLAPLALSPALATDYQGVQPAALDQPRIYAYLSLTPGGPPQQFEETFNIEAFFDTGASGILLSNNTAAFLGLAPSTYNDQTVIFSDVGVVGSDNFHVSPQVHFGLAKYHPSADVDNIETYSTVYNQVFGPVRTQMGPVEPVVENPLLENLDVIGIPLMHNKVVVMDPRPVNTFLDTMRTYVYNPNTPFNPAQEHSEPGIPVTDRHIRLSYGNFERFTTINPAGAPGPTLRDNPFVGPNPVRQLDPNPPPDNTPGIKSCYTNLCTTGSWLLDTGAAASIISTAQAGNVNVTYDPAHPMGSADPRLLGVPEDEQFQLTIGGVGGTTKIAGFFLDSMLLRTIEGNAANDDDPNHIRFLKAPVLVGDITIRDPQTNQTLTLDGILGMNFFVASAFVSEGAEGEFPFIGNLTRGVFDWVVFDQPNGRLGLKEGVIPEQGRPSWFGNIFANEGEWDVEVSDNWIDGGSPSTYQDGDHVIFSDAIWSNRVRITEPVAPGSMTFTNSDDPDSGVNFTFRGEAIGGFTNIEKIGTGRVTFFNSNTYKGTTNIQHGLIEFLAPQDIGDVNVAAGASVHFGAASHIWTLRVADGEASVSSGRGNTLVTQGVEISGTGRLNLADNAIIIKVDPEDLAATVADVNSMVARGLADDTGLVSGMGLANRRLGVIRNNINGAPIYTSFFGESGLSGDEVLVLYTVIGDLNLDQAVTISDFIDLAAHFNSPGTWQDGDVNYDGMVTISDFIDLASNFNTTYSGEVMLIDPAHAQMLADFAAANVPEPSVMLLSLHSLFLLRRRRRTGI